MSLLNNLFEFCRRSIQPFYSSHFLPDDRIFVVERSNCSILVLSHLFPSSERPIAGTFVYDQIAALRKHCNFDARILCGIPLWLPRINPFEFWKVLRTYLGMQKNRHWSCYAGVPVRYVPYLIFGPYSTHYWSYSRAMSTAVDYINDFNFNLVHAHTAYPDGVAGAKIAKKRKVPFLITSHTGPFQDLINKDTIKNVTIAALMDADKIIAVSNYQKETLLHYLNRDPKDIAVVPNMVDTEIFSPIARPIKSIKQGFTILSVGLMSPVKNTVLLLYAFKKVLNTFAKANLIIVGAGLDQEYDEVIFNLINELNINKYVEVLEVLPRTEIAKLMATTADLFVLSSKTETFGCVLIEAMASGLPIVCTNCGGPVDIVNDPRVGLICQNDNPEALSEAIIKILDNIKYYSPSYISEKARQRYSTRVVAGLIARVALDLILS